MKKIYLLIQLTILISGQSLCQTELVVNGDFTNNEQGWTFFGTQQDFFIASLSCPGNSVPYLYLGTSSGGYKNNGQGGIYQDLVIPMGVTYLNFSFEFSANTYETTTSSQNDFFIIRVMDNTAQASLYQVEYSNLDAGSALNCQLYTRHSYTINNSSLSGHTIRIMFQGTTDSQNPTVFRLDDISLTTSVSQSQYGSVKATIQPPAAIKDGAQWNLDGGNWQNSGTTLPNILTGIHNVNFKNISGWTTSSSQNLNVTAGNAMNVTGTYTQVGTTSNTISGNVKDVKVNTQTRAIEFFSYGGCSVNAYYAGTNNLAGSSTSASNGNFQITLPSSGNFDIKATDNLSPSNSVKIFNIPSNTSVGNINIPASLLQEVTDAKNKLLNLKPSLSSLGSTLISYDHNVLEEDKLITKWRNITTDANDIIEAASRLFIADSVLKSFYVNADKLDNEIATDVYEIAKALYSFTNIFKKIDELTENTWLDFLVDLGHDVRDELIKKFTDEIEKSLAFTSSESYGLKIFIISQLERFKDDAYDNTFFTLIQPLIEGIAANYIIRDEYIQSAFTTPAPSSSQYSLNTATNMASSLRYTGDFTTHFNATKNKIIDAQTVAELARIQSELHREYSNIISSASSWFDATSNLARITGLKPLAALLRGLAFGGKMWAGGELGLSIAKARTGFINNRNRLQPTILSIYRNFNSQNLQKNLSLESLQDAVTNYNTRLNDLKVGLLTNNIRGVVNQTDIVTATTKRLNTEVRNSFIPIMSVAASGISQDENFDSLIYSKFSVTLNLQPNSELKFQICYIAYLMDSTDLVLKDSLLSVINELITKNNSIVPEFNSAYLAIQNVPSLNYIQILESSIPIAIENGMTKNCKIKFRNFGPDNCTDLYAKILFDTPFETSIDSIYIGQLPVGQTDSLSFSINASANDTATNYTISFFANNTIGDDIIGIIKSRSKPPVPTISFNNRVCLGDTLNLFANSGSSEVRYHWAGPNGFSSNIQNPKILNIGAGNMGTYTCYVSSDGLNSALTSLIVSITVPHVSIKGNLDFCGNSNTILTATGAVFYSWSNGQTDSSVVVKGGGIYTVVGVDPNGCKDTAKVTTIALPAPTVKLSSVLYMPHGERMRLVASAIGNNPLAYKWTPNYAMDNDTIANPIVKPSISTTYTLTVTDKNGCSITKSIDVEVTGFFAYPNPARDFTTLYGSNVDNGKYSITLVDGSGKEFYREDVTVETNNLNIQIPISTLSAGIYFLSVRNSAVLPSKPIKIIKI